MIYLALAIVFILMQGFFSGIETGLVSILKPRVQHAIRSNVRGAKILHFFLSRPGYMLATTLIGTNLCIACASNMAKKGAETLGFASTESIIFLTVAMTIILLILEIVPKDWFRQQPYQRCLIFAYILYGAYLILYVPVHIMAGFTGIINRIFGRKTTDEDSVIDLMREDFILFIRDSESSGAIDAGAAEILERSLDFNSLTAGEIMCKRRDVKEISSSCTIAEAVECCRRTGISRLPVKKTGSTLDTDAWMGIFSVYDAIFTVPEKDWQARKVTDLMRPVVSLPEDSLLDEILVRAKKNRSPILAVCSAKDSRHIGIVTPNDVVKQLFG